MQKLNCETGKIQHRITKIQSHIQRDSTYIKEKNELIRNRVFVYLILVLDILCEAICPKIYGQIIKFSEKI